MNFSYPTKMTEIICAQLYVFVVEKSSFFLSIFAYFLFYSKTPKLVIIPEIHIFGRNTFIHCSPITVAHVHVNSFV